MKPGAEHDRPHSAACHPALLAAPAMPYHSNISESSSGAGPQLEEVAGEHELDAAEGRRAAAQLARRLLQLLQELGRHHADLVDDQHLTRRAGKWACKLPWLGFVGG